MKKPFFTGTCTALVTPFLEGKVNFPMMEQLLRRQIDCGIDTVVISGTTGEAPTLSREEKLEMFRRAKEYTGEQCKIIAGTGCNDTAQTVNLSQAAEQAGADALLVVSPYYNKPTEEGLIKHYEKISESTNLPVILYNVPSRTGVDIPVSVYRHLSQIDSIAGVKEATSSIGKIIKIIRECKESLPVWCGNDELTISEMAIGAKGVVSVVSNALPMEMRAMTDAALLEDYKTAAAIELTLSPLMEELFCESNPIPIKYVMKLLGYDCGKPRLPLTTLTKEHQNKIVSLLK